MESGSADYMNAHHFYNITPGGIVLAKTWFPQPVCPYSDLIHLWARANSNFKIIAESASGMGAEGSLFFERNWWLKGQDLLTLNEEEVSTAIENAPLQDLTEIAAYFDIDPEKAEVSSILEQVLGKEADNGPIFLWQCLNGEELVKIQRGLSEDSSPGIVKTGTAHIEIFLVKETTLEIPGTRSNGPVTHFDAAFDHKNEMVFFASEENIYILSLDALFDTDIAED